MLQFISASLMQTVQGGAPLLATLQETLYRLYSLHHITIKYHLFLEKPKP